MQILHFIGYATRGNSHRVANFFRFIPPQKTSLQLAFANFIIAFVCPTSWVILKQLDPSPSRATSQ